MYKIEITNIETKETIYTQTFDKLALLFPKWFQDFKEEVCRIIYEENK